MKDLQVLNTLSLKKWKYFVVIVDLKINWIEDIAYIYLKIANYWNTVLSAITFELFQMLLSYQHLTYYIVAWATPLNPIRSGLSQTANDPGGGGGGGGALKAPPTISNNIVSIFTISYMCILPGVLGMFQLEFFKDSRF